MARFANAPQSLAPRKGPSSIGLPIQTRTSEGGVGFIPGDPHVELFNAAVSGLLADGFYESANVRISRLIELVPKCDPTWLVNFIAWLRSGAYLRSASVVLAAEYVRSGFPNGRQVVASALQRPDEPGEILGYWFSRYGRNLPASLKRGVADATQRMFNEHAVLNYDGQNRAFRIGDVIELTHPKPVAAWQSDLFKFALDRRRHDVTPPPSLPKIQSTLAVDEMPQNLRTDDALLELLADPTVQMSWERASAWLGRPLNARTWEAVLPNMGYLALLRNLRNFEQAGVDPQPVIRRLLDPQQIERSRVLPFRFLSAYRALEGDVYRVALSDAAQQSLSNLPTFEGRTLLLVDKSGSMDWPVGDGKSTNPLRRTDVAAFYGEALARRCQAVDLYAYNTNATPVQFRAHVSILKAATSNAYTPSGGTHTWTTVRSLLKPHHDRVIVITDEQSHDSDTGTGNTPIITWNVVGDKVHHTAHGQRNRYLVSGYSDTALQTLPAVIAFGSTGRWPWE